MTSTAKSDRALKPLWATHKPPKPTATTVFSDPVAPLSEAAKILGISVWTLKREAKAKRITILKLSPRRLGIRMSEIERFLAAANYADAA